MCGIVGFFSYGSNDDTALKTSLLQKMTDKIQHRGPNASGTWIDPDYRVFLGHRRLSILDVSPLGAQPMESSCGRFVITYNGEIYNYLELREKLLKLGLQLKSSSDTEVLLEHIVRFGFESTLKELNGMFAFALYDRSERTLFLARDRFGEKPLYFGWMEQTFLFGSELKPLCIHPSFRKEIDPEALNLFTRLSYVPSPFSIFRGISKLTQGHFLKIRVSGKKEEPLIQPYYHLYKNCKERIAARSQHQLSEVGSQETVQRLEDLLTDAVRIRMRSDVPLGAFLSGGIDSSLIVALMQKLSSRAVKTFSIGFREEKYNEAQFAKEVARKLGTDHTELYVSPEEAQSVIPLLPTLYDEPFADSSQIPTYIVSKLARTQVTVSLSGDAGDELFGGYNRYLWASRIWKLKKKWPNSLINLGRGTLGALSPDSWDSLVSNFSMVFPKKFRHRQIGSKVYQVRDILSLKTQSEVYLSMVSQIQNPNEYLTQSRGSLASGLPHFKLDELKEIAEFEERMMFTDLNTYLPDDILVKVDRASMGVGLESRVPFLDPRVVDFAWDLVPSMKIRKKETKWILRQILYKYVDRRLVDRPKMGFGVPVDEWLRGPLKSWAESLLNKEKLEKQGLFNYSEINSMWNMHLSQKKNTQNSLWNFIMFQQWFDTWMS